jgi:DNA repair protein RecO (recombination protein O)
MSEIVKTEAFVLGKIDFRDSSNIASLFTKNFGRLQVIVKGAKSSKNKIGLAIDPPNHLSIIMYKKDGRDLQLLTSVDIISHYPLLKSELEKLKYSYAILELIRNLTPENEHNLKLYNGLERIFYLLDTSEENPKILFARFFMFFLTEIGYELQLDECKSCGRSNISGQSLSYNYELGIICSNCKGKYLESFSINSELFECLICLKKNKSLKNIKDETVERANKFMELYVKYHISDFKGIQSFLYLN